MSYDEYAVKVRARMKKLVAAENFIKKYRFLIIAVADIIFIAFIFTMYFAGSYTRDLSARDVIYGEDGITRAAAFLSGIKYTYTENGEELTGLPNTAGSFDITAETKNPFGVIRRQSASLTVYKKSAFVALSDFSTEYGEEPDALSLVSAEELAIGDSIAEAEVDYDRFAKTSDAKITKITIINRYGADVTSSYDLRLGEAKATVTPRKITVDTGSAEKKYDKEELICRELEITAGSLAYDDAISAEFPASITVPGTVSNKADIKIYGKNGEDVSDKYTVTERIGALTVQPLEIRIKTGSAEKEYDGKTLECREYEIISSELPEGYECVVSGFPKRKNPGSIYNTVTVKVRDENKKYVDESIYDAKIDRGILTVTGRKITLTSNSSAVEYDGKPHNAIKSVKLTSGELYENDHFSTYNHPSETVAGVYNNTFSVRFEGVVPDEAYDITYEYGTLTITKRPLVLTVTVSGDKSRNGAAFTADIEGVVVDSDSINTPFYIPTSVTYEAFENYIDMNLFISHGTDRIINSADSYDITYIIKYDEDELEKFRAEAGSADKNGQGGEHGGTHGDGTAPDTDMPEDTQPVGEKYGDSGIGINGVGGGIDNSPSPYAELPDSTPDLDKTAAGSVSSYKEGAVYLRLRSFGNYTGTGWAEPALYDKKSGVNPLNMTYTTLIENSYTEQNELEVDYYANDGLVPVPYYSESVNEGKYVMTDVAVPKDNSDKKTYYYRQIPVLGIPSLLALDSTDAVNDEYKEFVYNNYLSLSEETEIQIKNIIKKAGLKASSPTIISDVAEFVKQACIYNGAFEMIPDGEDRVIYFLTRSRQGVCGHFASAATVIYRALGIPARYTVGYYVVTNGHYEKTEFYAKDAHAWPEVFVDGIGWVPVEVTSPSVGEDGRTSALQPPQGTDTIFYNKLYYKMASKSKVYDGEELYSDEAELMPGSNLRDGDVIIARTDPVRYVGTGSFESTEFAVYDSKGNDVTLLYEVRQTGKAELSILPLIVDMQDIEIYVGQSVNAPSYENALDEDVSALLPDGFVPEFDLMSDQAILTDGKTITGVLSDGGRILKMYIDSGGEDKDTDDGAEIILNQKVTVMPFENVRIKEGDAPKEQTGVIRKTGENGRIYNYIAVKSDTAEKSFDGKYLHSSDCEILSGALAAGHSLEFESAAYQLYAGQTKNIFSRLMIKDGQGLDVTGEYMIDFYPGCLTVTTGEYTVTDTEIDAEVDKKLSLDDVNRTAGVTNVRVSYGVTGDKPIVRVQDGVLIGIEPGVTHINAVFAGEDINGDGVNEYATSSHTLTVTVKPKQQPENTGIYIALAGSSAVACFAVAVVSLKAARMKKKEILQKQNSEE